MNALVIDDSRTMQSIIKQMLVDIGFDVTEAAHGKQALENLAGGTRFDVALVDWNMPMMNGLEFVQTVRADEALDDMRLMMVTTKTERSQVAQALDEGADEYLMKPFTKEILQTKLGLLGLLNGDECAQSAS